MAIKKRDLAEMNDILSKGKTIAQIVKKYPKYEQKNSIHNKYNFCKFLNFAHFFLINFFFCF